MKRLLIILALTFFAFQVMDAQYYRIFKNKVLTNDSDDQLAPVPFMLNGDTGIVYMSNSIVPGASRPRLNIVNPDPENSKALSKSPMNLYFYDTTDRRGIKRPMLLDPGRFYTIGDDGPATFSGDFRKMCIVQPQKDPSGKPVSSGFSGLFFAAWVDGEWSEPEPFSFNDPEINFSTPCLSKDGQILFFAAEGDLEGAIGGMDIYYSMNSNGTWSAPVNLGERINTADHEIFPFYYQAPVQGTTTIRLYFSSKGHNARAGSFDLFYSEFFNGEWLVPIAVPSVNSVDDELGIYINEDRRAGMFTRKDNRDRFNIYNFTSITAKYEPFGNPGPAKKAPLCYVIYEKSMDTIDPVVFDYEWVINDEIHLPGHKVSHCFPGPGEYSLAFNVTNKLTDTTIVNAAHIELRIPDYRQPIITAPDTVLVGERVPFSAAGSNLPDDWDQVEYFWDFNGDYTTQEKGENLYHTYERKGEDREYKVTVILGAKKVLSRSEERMVRNNELEESEFKMGVSKEIVVLQE